MTKSPRDVVRELLLEHKGSDDPITAREISEVLNQSEVGSFPQTRMLIRDIMMEDQIPVASSTNGYYVITAEEELRDYVDQLESRILGMTERKMMIQKAANQWDGDIETDDDFDLL